MMNKLDKLREDAAFVESELAAIDETAGDDDLDEDTQARYDAGITYVAETIDRIKSTERNRYLIAGLAVLALVVVFAVGFLVSRGGGGSDSGLTIDEPAFAASSACDGEGTFELTMEGGEPMATAIGDIDMTTGGMPSIWCDGLRHRFVGSVTYEGYVFDSDADDPLEFVVDRDDGYHYVAGTGTVEKPGGDIVTLP